MARFLEATCAAGVVKVGNLPVTDAIILSLGDAPLSSGILILEGALSYYVASSAPDIKTLIENMSGIVQQISLILTGLDAGAPSPGTQAASITALGLLKTQLDLTKEALI